MKKLIIVTILCLISSLAYSEPSNSENVFESDIFKPVKDDYVLYYDTRGDQPRLVGFKYLDETHYLIRYYKYETEENYLINVTVKITEKKVSITNFIFIEGDTSINLTGEATELFSNLLNNSDRLDKSPYPQDLTLTQTRTAQDVEYKQELRYKYWVPVFQLHEITQTLPKEAKVVLIGMSSPSKSGYDDFETFTTLPPTASVPKTVIEEAEEIEVDFGSIKVILDKNWKQQGDYFLLPINTEHDAALTVQSYGKPNDLDHISLQVAYLKLMFAQSQYIHPQSISLQEYNDRTVLQYKIYDSNTGRYTLVFHMFFLQNNTLLELNLFSFEDLFINNYDYFNNLLKSISLS
ncbi:hypothetical protein [Spirochaeta cellobiosiphila]|uniref:hypothetical protein n=1 Tax=Spirochaeta cellobiosiphila TaxID=504483 RepID=UPI0004148B56|nr:hypothetical protein [Spirochaeta cellobiosiphila]